MEPQSLSFPHLETHVEPALLRDGPPTHAVSRLTGWLERQGFHPILAAFLLFVVSFILFQGIATVVALALIVSSEGMPNPDNIMDVLGKSTGPLLAGNTIGQFLGMAVPVLLWTRLHTRDPANFLRLKAPDPTLLILAGVGLIALLPCIQWLGQINETLPLPRFLVELERSQMELIERILGSDMGLSAMIFALAITPAICEEILFRGYLQRQFERSMGAAGGIIVTGLLFGLYHFRLSQAVPLAALGIYLGYLVWRTGSIWIVVAIHFLNNGFAIAANTIVAANPDLGIEDIENVAVPWTFVLAGALILFLVVAFIDRRVRSMDEQATYKEVGSG